MIRFDAAMVAAMADSIGLRRNDGHRLDAGETAFLAKQLEYVSAQIYETQYPALLARKFIPVDSSVPTGAQSWTYRMWDQFGMAEIIHSYADDLPMVGRLAKEVNEPIRSLGDSYGYSLQDLRAALFAGVPLSADLAVAARRAIEQKIDDIAATGSSDDGLSGFLNHPNIPTTALPTGNWAAATPLQILKDLQAMQTAIVKTTKQLITPDTVLFPQDAWEIVNNTPMSDVNTTTILKTFLNNSPYIRNADVWPKLDTAAAGGNPLLVMYARSPEVVSLVIPQEFEELPPQAKSLSFVVPCHARCGGVSVKYPLGATYGTGV